MVAKMLANNVKAASCPLLEKAGVDTNTLRQWCINFEQCLRLEHYDRCLKLVGVVATRAQKLETAAANERARAWRQALTRTTAGPVRKGVGRPLSRLAFR